MEDSEKTREELIAELDNLRKRLAEVDFNEVTDQYEPAQELDNGEALPRHLTRNGFPTETIDLTTLFHTDITSSGSFDIRGDIWSTTFGKVLQAIPIPVLLVDKTYRVTAANEACIKISRNYKAVIGLPFSSLFAGHATAAGVQTLIEKTFEDRKPRIKQGVLSIEKAMMWGRMTLRSIRIMTERFLLVLVEDLTKEKRQLLVNLQQQEALRTEMEKREHSQKALKESNSRFRRIYESAPMMIQTVDVEGVIRNVNSKWLQEFGYSREEAVGKRAQDMLLEGSQRKLPAFLEELWRNKEIRDVHLQCSRKDGQTMEVLLDAVVVEDPKWGAVGLSTIRDVTHQMVLEQQLREAQKMEAIGTLAGGIAHDFNNLLQIVLGFSDLLLMRKDWAAPDYTALQSIREAAQRGAELVRQILTFSRKVPTAPRSVNLNLIVEDAVKLLSRTIPKMIRIKLDLQDQLKFIFADKGQIEQVLMNLLINSKDAMPDGGQVTVSTRHLTLDKRYCRLYPEVQPGDYVVLTVSDTGQGMEEDVIDRVFEPFFTTKGPGEGSGLGLAMVFGIVKSHGGHIVCQSLPGKGTKFEVYVPALDLGSAADMSEANEFPAFGTEGVLLVDDEELIRRFGTEVLGNAGYKVLTAVDGQEALNIYRRRYKEIDLVILDIVMPGMGGKKCLEELLRIDPNVKVLIASGQLIDQSSKVFLEERARGIVAKPFKAAELVRCVRSVLDKA